jgi:D-hexose-6-phosphate mutarotase
MASIPGGMTPNRSQIRAAARDEKWALKQVQGDEDGVVIQMLLPSPIKGKEKIL